MNKPIITIHDSFIVVEEDEELLRHVMHTVFSEKFSLEISDSDKLIKKEH
jgi:hypothetical protein